jgi:hypothetical protein
VAQLYPQALGSPFVVSYDSQGYGGGIRTHLHKGNDAISSKGYIKYVTKLWLASHVLLFRIAGEIRGGKIISKSLTFMTNGLNIKIFCPESLHLNACATQSTPVRSSRT